MKNTVDVYLYGKKYEIPENLTILSAFEYAGYKLVRGVGCRNGHCGACAVFYRIKDDNNLYCQLACQTKVQHNMYVATLPFFPVVKKFYELESIEPSLRIIMQLYPEIYKCIGCNSCSKACPQGIDVMQYINYAQRGDFENVTNLSFNCVMCGICSARCPANISHNQVAMLCRRLTGKYLYKKSDSLQKQIDNLEKYSKEFDELLNLSQEEILEKYVNRNIE